jgi:hypothetical protein
MMRFKSLWIKLLVLFEVFSFSSSSAFAMISAFKASKSKGNRYGSSVKMSGDPTLGGQKLNSQNINSEIQNKKTADKEKFSPATLIFPFGVADAASSSDEESVSVENKRSIAAFARSYGFEYLVHQTQCSNLPIILEFGKLLPGIETKTIGLSGLPKKEVYLSLGHVNDDPLAKNYRSCILFFDLDLLDQRNDFHITNHQAYGQYLHINDVFNDDIIIDAHFSARANELNKLKSVLKSLGVKKKIYRTEGEVVLTGAVELDKLAKVYVGSYDSSMSDEEFRERAKILDLVQKAGLNISDDTVM